MAPCKDSRAWLWWSLRARASKTSCLAQVTEIISGSACYSVTGRWEQLTSLAHLKHTFHTDTCCGLEERFPDVRSEPSQHSFEPLWFVGLYVNILRVFHYTRRKLGFLTQLQCFDDRHLTSSLKTSFTLKVSLVHTPYSLWSLALDQTVSRIRSFPRLQFPKTGDSLKRLTGIGYFHHCTVCFSTISSHQIRGW